MDLESNRTYTANGLNQYTNIVEGAGGFLPQFDDDGNQTLIKTATGVWQVTYNGENRPTHWERISSNSSTPTLISMSFDRMGRRVQYLETCGSLTNSNKAFTYDGYLQIANFEHQTSNFKLQTFIWDPTEPVATRPLVWNFSTFQPFNFSTSYYTHDMRPRRRRRVARRSVATEPRSGRKRPRNKNVSDLVASSNLSVTAHYEYAPFGKIIVDAGSNEVACAIGQSSCNPFGFSSEYNDEALDLVYYNYRHYKPIIGQWVNQDLLENSFYSSVEEHVGNVEEHVGKLLYAFVLNNPICFLDYIGLVKIEHKYHNALTPGASNCLGGAMTGCGNQYRSPNTQSLSKTSFIGAMLLEGWKCNEVTSLDECKDLDCHDRILIALYKNDDERNNDKNPWTDPKFEWGYKRSENEKCLTDIHAIRYDREKGRYKQIPQASAFPQEFDYDVKLALFKIKNIPLLCCHKRIKE